MTLQVRALAAMAAGADHDPRVFYVDGDEHLISASLADQKWRLVDVTRQTTVVSAEGDDRGSFAIAGTGIAAMGNVALDPRVYFLNESHEIVEFGPSWWRRNVGHDAGDGGAAAPRPGPIAAVGVSAERKPRVYFIDANQHLRELCWEPSGWSRRDLTEQDDEKGVRAAAGSPVAAVTVGNARNQRVYFIDQNQHVHQLEWRERWRARDVTIAAGAPAAGRLQIAAVGDSTAARVYFLDSSGLLHELTCTPDVCTHKALQPGGSYRPLSASSSLVAVLVGAAAEPRLYYTDDVGHLHELALAGSEWHDTDLTNFIKAVAADPAAPLAAVAGGPNLEPAVYFSNTSGHLCEFASVAGEWLSCDVTAELPRKSGFTLVITSDPQYPWYDKVCPPNLPDDEDKIKENSSRQISQQYASINTLADQRVAQRFPVKAAIINGDLTAFGHPWQLEKFESLCASLKVKTYIALGNHDYANNVDDCLRNRCANGMVQYMWQWLRANAGSVKLSDLKHEKSGLTDTWEGSLAYSFTIGHVHIVMLQNYPAYKREWNNLILGIGGDTYNIKPSLDWLSQDLEQARERFETTLVFTHAYNDDQFQPGPEFEAFKKLVARTEVSAVFAGHIHSLCAKIDTITGGNKPVPVFRSGAASYQDYLVADLDFTKRMMTLTKYQDLGTEGKYLATNQQWQVPLNGLP